MPELNPEVASYVLNRANFDLFNPTMFDMTDFTSTEKDAYAFMNEIIKKKLALAEIPSSEKLDFK